MRHPELSGIRENESESHSVLSASLWPHGLYNPWNSSGQNTGVGSHFLLQGIFPTQGSNPGLPHCRWILYQLSHKGSPTILEWVAYPFSSKSSWLRNLTRVSCIAGGFFTNWANRERLGGKRGNIHTTVLSLKSNVMKATRDQEQDENDSARIVRLRLTLNFLLCDFYDTLASEGKASFCTPGEIQIGVCPAMDRLIFLQLKPPTKHLLHASRHQVRHIILWSQEPPDPAEQASKGGGRIRLTGKERQREQGTCLGSRD